MNEHKSCERKQMSCADVVRTEMQERVRDIAALAPEASRKAAIDFAARVLRMPFERVRNVYYGRARRIEAHEADQIRAYCEAANKLLEAREQYEAYRQSFLRDHPALARFAPGPLPAPGPGPEASEDQPQAIEPPRPITGAVS